LATNVISPGAASRIPETPEMETAASPTRRAPIRSASAPRVSSTSVNPPSKWTPLRSGVRPCVEEIENSLGQVQRRVSIQDVAVGRIQDEVVAVLLRHFAHDLLDARDERAEQLFIA